MNAGSEGTTSFAQFLQTLSRPLQRYGYFIGPVAAIYFWLSASLDVYLNRSWWHFFQKGNSFSAMGDPNPQIAGSLAWVYNDVVLLPTAMLILLFSLVLVVRSRNKVETAGSSFFFVAGTLLAGIGIYHEGTTPHITLTFLFFALADLSILVWGLGVLAQGQRRLALGMLLVAIPGAALASMISWPSVAVEEAVGILLIDVWIGLLFLARREDRPT